MHFEITRTMTKNPGTTEIHVYSSDPGRKMVKPVITHVAGFDQQLLHDVAEHLKPLEKNKKAATFQLGFETEFSAREIAGIQRLFERHNAVIGQK